MEQDLGQGMTVIGGAPFSRSAFEAARALAPFLVAADSGADALEALGAAPDVVMGDMDSIAGGAGAAARHGARFRHVEEQDSTDFEKCINGIAAPFAIAVGVQGGRLDHTFAALHALLAAPMPTVLLTDVDVIFAPPPVWRARLEPGARVAFLPLRAVRAEASDGLRWPLEGARYLAGERIGACNIAERAEIAVRFDAPGMIATLEARFLREALRSIGAALSTPAC